jgi:hypothetical protein
MTTFVIVLVILILVAVVCRHLFYKWMSAQMKKGLLHMVVLFLFVISVTMLLTTVLVYILGSAALGALIGCFYAMLAYFDASPFEMILISSGLGAMAGAILLRSSLKTT